MSAAITLVRERDTQPAGLVFVDELPVKKKAGKYASVAAALREQTGRWAVVKTFTLSEKHKGWSLANHINSGKFVDFPKGQFQASAISDEDACRVYVRHLPVVEVAR